MSASMYPVAVEFHTAKHAGGTKEYHMVLIRTNDGRGMVINRWGRLMAAGQMSVEKGDFVDVRRAFDKKYKDKYEGEYRQGYSSRSKIANSLDELRQTLGFLWAKLGKDNATWLAPGVDVSDVREPDKDEFVEQSDGSFRKKPRAPRLVETPEPSVADRAKDDPLFGLF